MGETMRKLLEAIGRDGATLAELHRAMRGGPPWIYELGEAKRRGWVVRVGPGARYALTRHRDTPDTIDAADDALDAACEAAGRVLSHG